MKNKRFIRPLFYVLILVVVLITIHFKKMSIIEDRKREAVSLLVELEKHGHPVDVEQVGSVDLKDTLRFTLQTPNAKSSTASFFMSRNQRGKIKVGQAVLGLPKNEVIGRVSFVANGPNLANGLYEGRVELNNKGRQNVESFATVNIVIATLQDRLSIPVEAVQRVEGKTYVWRSNEGQAERVEVKLGAQVGSRFEVVSGLNRGDLVVINGQRALEADVKLRHRDCTGCSGSKEEVKS